jgi:hypothetical protein
LLEAVEDRWNLIRKAAVGSKDNPPDWRAAAWSLERAFASDFCRPEFQLNLATNVVQNNLTITISPQEVREIEATAEPVRESVRKMYEQYRPSLGNGNGNGNGHGERTVDVAAEPVRAEDLAPITSKENSLSSGFSLRAALANGP